MGVRRLRDVIEAYQLGQFGAGQVRKTPSSTWVNGHWADLTLFGVQPGAFYYPSAPLAFAPVSRSVQGGWDHGPPVAPATKYLKRVDFTYLGQSLCGLIVDVVGYYPFFEPGSPGEDVPLENIVARAPRHGAGDGVRAYLVSVGSNNLFAGNTITLTYTNSDGVAGRTTSAPMQNQTSANGALMNVGAAVGMSQHPFFPLMFGDRGMQQVDAIRVDGPGDGGVMTLVLCREIARLPPAVGTAGSDPATMRAPTEHDYLRTSPLLPVIDDDAYMSALITHFNSAAASTSLASFFADFDYFWK